MGLGLSLNFLCRKSSQISPIPVGGFTGILCVLCHAILCVNMLLTVHVIVSDGFPKKFVLGGGDGSICH